MSGTHEALTPDFSRLFNRNELLPADPLGTFVILKEVAFCILQAGARMLWESILHPLL